MVLALIWRKYRWQHRLVRRLELNDAGWGAPTTYTAAADVCTLSHAAATATTATTVVEIVSIQSVVCGKWLSLENVVLPLCLLNYENIILRNEILITMFC